MEYRVLGPLEVLAAGGEKLALGGAMQRSVLASLLLRRGQTVARDRLIDDLWDKPPETAARTVQVYVSRLRHQLPSGAIESHPGGYRLVVDGAELDLEMFEQRAQEGIRHSPPATTSRPRPCFGERSRSGGGRHWSD
jgi:DNA-binding SARP family transcriptional activator